MVDVGRLLLLHERWEESLPSVHPFYAVKCNNDPVLLQTLARLGCGFDCASKVREWSVSCVCDYVLAGLTEGVATGCLSVCVQWFDCQQGGKGYGTYCRV